MKEIKKQEGITLVALIITIVVLLILAVVAIGTVAESNIINHASNTSIKYNEMQAAENGLLNSYEKELENTINKIAGNKKYYNYTVKDLSQAGLGTLVGEYSGTADEVMLITNEEYSPIFMVRRASENYIAFHIVEDMESMPTLGYFYDFVNNQWYDIDEEEINEVPTITFSNARVASTDELEKITGMVEGVDYIAFSEELINAIFTITPVE